MAVHFKAPKPQELLKKFNDRIEQKEPSGKITTWKRTADKKYYTHVADDWTQKAYFSAQTENGELIFNIIRPKGKGISVVVYAYYHGHLIETFLAHFDQDFSIGQATALAETGDNVTE